MSPSPAESLMSIATPMVTPARAPAAPSDEQRGHKDRETDEGVVVTAVHDYDAQDLIES